MYPRARRFVRVRALLAALVVAASGWGAAQSQASATGGRWFGLISPTPTQQSQLAGTAIKRVTLSAGWAQLEPGLGQYDLNAAAALKSQLTGLLAKGYQVSLDLGLQYAPAWVFSLPGQTRFVNQDGQVWYGGLGEDVPNAVFNTSVRQAQAAYISALGSYLGAANFASVRVGGLLSGELRYPLGGTDKLWDYDPAAQANAPYPGWKPGTGTATQARASLQYYFDSLTGYETWLMQTVNKAFPSVNQQVMFPSWGLRPGMVDAAVQGGLTGKSVAEANGLISMGLDWANQVAAIRNAGVNGTVYTTWLEAPTQGTSVQQISPIEYLAQLASQYGLPLAGENAGGGGTAALALCVQRANALGLQGIMYFAGPSVADGSAGVSLANLLSAASS